ncbi:hypothetical protein MTP99_008732 [Tenebrio molitor]|jgi:hypothetical protein|nr:hypothetical protein MTP99_008732 [Tenebrio molitor]
MPLLGFLARHRTFFDDDIDRPELVFAVGNATKSKYHPGCVVGDVDKRTSTVPVYFFHNEQERDVCVDDVIYHHGNLMMLKASFCRRGKVYTGTVYGNDSPKYDGEPRTFFVKVSKKEVVSVPVKNVFLTRFQAQKLLHSRPNKNR